MKISTPPRNPGLIVSSEVRKALSELQAALVSLYGKGAPQLLLYGSYARGDANEASDIDVLFIYAKLISPGEEISRLSRILADLNLRYQVLISLHPVSADRYRAASGVYWNNVRREGVPVEGL